MNNSMLTRRNFVVASAVTIAGLALTGCGSAASQSASASAASSAQEAASESSAASSPAASQQATSSVDQSSGQESSSSQSAPSGQESSSLASSEQAGASSTEESAAGAKVLVACFSATGNTKAIAEKLVGHLGADYFEIEAAEPYTDDDLNYNDSTTRATVEQNTPDTRPGIAALPDFSSYDVVYLGHPIWWGKAPRLICTLLEGSDLSGKKVAEFCTSGSSGVEGATGELQGLAPNAEWVGAQRFAAGTGESEVAAWADSLGV